MSTYSPPTGKISKRIQIKMTSKGIDHYLAEANNGDAAAQYELGMIYQEGRGVSKDNEEAIRWFRLAVDHDDFAQYCLGVLRIIGIDTSEDRDETAKWYRLAAENGYALAQYNLGYSYESGLGLSRDHNEALKWYRLAAEKGSIDAENRIRILCKDNSADQKQNSIG
jgi:TPR repeat protein